MHHAAIVNPVPLSTSIMWNRQAPLDHQHAWDPHEFSIGYDQSSDFDELHRVGKYLATSVFTSSTFTSNRVKHFIIHADMLERLVLRECTSPYTYINRI